MSDAATDQLGRLAGVPVLVAGDVMLDRYIHGDMQRISPEAPVPVLRIAHSREVLGGAGNVARNVTSLGGLATLAGVAGDDAAGATLEQL